VPTYDERRAALRADCTRCHALCCVVPGFARSSDFAIDKPAGRPCPNLQSDFRCGVHTELRVLGFAGCTVYDCLGAGQHVTQVVLGGHDWRTSPDTADAMVEVFPVVRDLFELLRYVAEAASFPRATEVHDALEAAYAQLEALTRTDVGTLVRIDVDAQRGAVNPLLLRASELQRAGLGGADHRGADLTGRSLRGADLRGASLRGARAAAAGERAAARRARRCRPPRRRPDRPEPARCRPEGRQPARRAAPRRRPQRCRPPRRRRHRCRPARRRPPRCRPARRAVPPRAAAGRGARRRHHPAPAAPRATRALVEVRVSPPPRP